MGKQDKSSSAETIALIKEGAKIIEKGTSIKGSAEAAKHETQRVLRVFGDGGLVIGTGCAPPPDTPAENIKAFMKAVGTSASGF